MNAGPYPHDAEAPRPPPKPDQLADRLDFGVPNELRPLKAWLLWQRGRDKPGEKFDKVPYYASGGKRFGTQGSHEDLARLVTFDVALGRLREGGYDGLGLAMIGQGIVGLDFDGCRAEDGVIAPWVLDLCDGTYMEVSPSGTGVRAFCHGTFPDRKNFSGHIETFCSRGYLTVTGDRLNGCDLAKMSPAVASELTRLLGPDKARSDSAGVLSAACAGDPVLGRLKERGLVLRDMGGGRFAIECPFEKHHTTPGGSGDTVYFAAHTGGYASGNFDCKHAHCAERPQAEFRAAIGMAEGPPNESIPFTEGTHHATGDAAQNDAQRRLLPRPSNPLAVARKLIEEKYQTDTDLTLINHRDDFFRWDGACWPEIDRLDIRRDAYVFTEGACYLDATGEPQPFAPTVRKINDLIDALRACVGIASEHEPPVWLDGRANPPASEIIAMQNGLLHLPTRTVLPHTPRFFAHNALAFPFVAEAPEPARWLDFLHQLWPGDHASVAALQELFGYVIGGDTRQQKIFLLVGPRRAGKGTIGRVLTGILGRHNVAAPTLASLSTNFGLAPLIGKPLALISDARLSAKADAKVVVERLLSISGEDSLTIDRKYREPWTGRLPSRIVILTNELPGLTDASGALSSRFIVLVLSESFLGRENPGLTDALLAEAPSILRWALEGLDRLNRRGHLVMPESGRDAVQQLEDLASPVAAFVRERCTLGQDASVDVDDLWVAWKSWCEGQGRGHGTKAVFGRDLHAALPALKKSRPRDGEERQRRAMEGRRPRREARDSPEGALSHCVSLRASDSEVAQVSAGRSRQKESLAASPRAPGGLGCPVAHPEGRGAIA